MIEKKEHEINANIILKFLQLVKRAEELELFNFSSLLQITRSDETISCWTVFERKLKLYAPKNVNFIAFKKHSEVYSVDNNSH